MFITTSTIAGRHLGLETIDNIKQVKLVYPKDFGYVLTDAYVNVSANTGGIDTEAVGSLRIYPGGTLGPQINVDLTSSASRQDSTGTTAVGSISAAEWNTNNPFFRR